MLTTCNNCGKNITKPPGNIKRWKKHFCNNKCYIEYRIKHPEEYDKRKIKYNKKPFKKLKRWAEIRENNEMNQNTYKIRKQ